MKKSFFSILLLCLVVFTNAQIRLPKLISNGMILQRETELTIWGWASPNESIQLTFKGVAYNSTADALGNWKINITKQAPGGPFEMKIKGTNEITISNILIGDIWLCSGQSNMELAMNRLKYKYANEVATANNTQIRQFLVPDKYDFNIQQKDVDAGEWLAVSTNTIENFSGVAYFFAKEIFEKNKIPVGLINASLGGSPAEAWISEAAIKKFPYAYEEAQKFKDNNLIQQITNRDQSISNTWYNYTNEFDLGHQQNWLAKHDFSDWKELKVPGYWGDSILKNGIIWFSKEINVPASMVGKNAKLELGRIIDADSVFINGKFVGNITYQYPPRRYELAPSILKEGKNTIVIRLESNSGNGGFVLDKKYELTTTTDTIDLTGNWKYKVGLQAANLPSQTFIRWKPTGLYNAMIAPLTNYKIKGVLWYQGESNTSHPDNYKEVMQTLIEDWRSKWSQNNLPFLTVQLANFMESRTTPQETPWAALRQQQLNATTIPNTYMAVIIDLGDWNDIHPENKLDVGHRLALLAQKNIYGDKNVIASGPIYQSMKVEGNKIVLSFSNIGTGLKANGDGELKHFAIAGADNKFIWAKAIIKGNTVIVWSPEINNPVKVRYAWADNPSTANLYNNEGLPASPFTTETTH